MDDDQVDDIPLARRRRSRRLLGQSNVTAVNKNETQDHDVDDKTDVDDQPKNPKMVFKRQLDNSNAGGQVETAVDCSSQRKKTKKAQEVKDQKGVKRDGSKKAKPATTSTNPTSSSASAQNAMKNLTTGEIEQMQHIQRVMDELKNVPDITEMIKDSDTNKMPWNLGCSSSSAPAMVSEGIGGRFQTVNFYWLDMFEEPEHPGVLFIFGKVKSPPPGNGYSSGCVVVKNLNRRLFLLPRATKPDGSLVDYMDVYNEFYTTAAPQLKLPWFQSKRSKRKYCFDTEGIPPEAEYMEVRYSGTAPALPHDVNGETFSHAFGTKASLMETFLLEKKLKGPCWLQLSYCERVQPNQQQSWSKFEFTCDVSSVKIHAESSQFPVPTIVLASLQTETVYDSDLKRNAFIFAGVAVHENFNLELPSPTNEVCHDFFCLINTPPGQTWPAGFELITNKRILKMDSELSMLECFVNKLHEIDADMYLDYGIELNRLRNQLSDLKVPNWSRIGKLKIASTRVPATKANSRPVIPGLLLCDMSTPGMPRTNLTYFKFRAKRNGKEQAASSLAGSEIKALYNTCKDIQSFVNWGMKHCVLKIREMNELQVLPLAFQTSCIAGDTLARMLLPTCSRRSEYLMLHALSAKDYIVRDDCQYLDRSITKDAAAESEIVQEPSWEMAFYDNYVLQLSFPSHLLHGYVLQGFQLVLSNDADVEAEEPRRSIQNELWKLGESQKQVVSLMEMKDVTEDQMREYEVRRMVLRNMTFDLTVDACKDWRLRSKTLKAYIKAQMKDTLLKVQEIVSKMGYKVIYVDESSMMIETDSLEISTVLQIEKKVRKEIKQAYPLLHSLVRTYRRFLVFKGNKYAGLLYDPVKESKYEVDLKHFPADPSIPIIVSKTARACLLEILSEQPLCDKTNKVGKILRDVGSKLRDGAFPFEELLISRKLTKDPEDYENTHGLHHVVVALRMNKSKMLNKFRKGDQVSYVLCKDGRPRHLIELKSKKDEGTNVIADPVLYLAQMVHPVVTEICERIPGLGLDSARVADALGLGGYSF